MAINANWKAGEADYCRRVVKTHGDGSVSYDPKTIATYLRLQASAAFRDNEFETAARLGAAATAINEDARNNHTPDWNRALEVLTS